MSTIYPDRRVMRTRLKLKSSLLETLSNHSLKNLTVASLCRNAGVNRTTFYHHYDSLDDLIHQLLDDMVAKVIEAYREPYTQLTSFQLQDLHFSEITLFHSVLKNQAAYTQVVFSPFLALFHQKLSLAIKDVMLSDLSQHGDVDHELYAVYHSIAVTGLLIYWIQTGFLRSPEEMADQLLMIVRHRSEQRFKVKTILSPLLIDFNRVRNPFGG
ncbi:TetR/AcrR family transcriptional regulator [Jeotgalibacillus salarius]|uniref:TetR/AcrR family transcriptional regulator n=1 Tax=Jeotgalibacillus salarius TaxID=546023 RepID=A0A4Y8LHD6_9BACL|nr:TetR/AcrR family transcriptional regulator [Jeotgalibacillus salarius]TFE02236.1 TetR/AcrR family transcriptional regulator [Jeotgalibacillus salarius]